VYESGVRLLLFLVFTSIPAFGQFCFSGYEHWANDAPWKVENGDHQREIDPRYNLDRLTPDEKLAYFAIRESFQVLYDGARPKNVSMTPYWQDTKNRMVQQNIGKNCISIHGFWITAVHIMQVLYNTVFVHVSGWTTLPVGFINTTSMDWNVGFEDLRSRPKLTVFWETSFRESRAEFQKILEKEEEERRCRKAQKILEKEE
jgi:hypothetical protein